MPTRKVATANGSNLLCLAVQLSFPHLFTYPTDTCPANARAFCSSNSTPHIYTDSGSHAGPNTTTNSISNRSSKHAHRGTNPVPSSLSDIISHPKNSRPHSFGDRFLLGEAVNF